jgi:hypothetical protein
MPWLAVLGHFSAARYLINLWAKQRRIASIGTIVARVKTKIRPDPFYPPLRELLFFGSQSVHEL